MRRVSDHDDGLDLLLDAICNTFGGIVFIALLVVLLLGNTSAIKAPSVQESLSPSEILLQQERLAYQLHDAREELKALQRLAAQQRKMLLQDASTESTIEKYDQLINEINNLEEQWYEQLELNARTYAETQQERQSIAKLDKTLEELEGEISELLTTLTEVRAKREYKMALPQVTMSTRKPSIGLILRYGRLYLWDYDPRTGERGLNTSHFFVINETASQYETHARPNAGIPLHSTDFCNGQIAELLRNFPPSRFNVTFVVREDSFDEFKTAREHIKQLGYRYSLIAGDGVVADRGGHSRGTQ
ncbi:hypothetical protein [Thalassoroseus pseudoceratinae]|uniref:hypothetical protein n=1 Tax=Thalassoroseus pseudoceratinae TaxID=2713176 RepID=UPI00142396EE|nr:hypothetical protein [Thalassoroseus pseudoceratinae]